MAKECRAFWRSQTGLTARNTLHQIHFLAVMSLQIPWFADTQRYNTALTSKPLCYPFFGNERAKKKKKVQTILFLLLDVQFTTPRQEKYCTEAGFLILINTWSQSLHPDFGWANSVLCKAKPSEEPRQLCHSAGDWRWQKPTRNCHSTTDGIRGMKGFASSLAKQVRFWMLFCLETTVRQ